MQPVTPHSAAQKTFVHTDAYEAILNQCSSYGMTFCGDITEPAHLLRLFQSPEMTQNLMRSLQMSTFLISEQRKHKAG